MCPLSSLISMHVVLQYHLFLIVSPRLAALQSQEADFGRPRVQIRWRSSVLSHRVRTGVSGSCRCRLSEPGGYNIHASSTLPALPIEPNTRWRDFLGVTPQSGIQ